MHKTFPDTTFKRTYLHGASTEGGDGGRGAGAGAGG